MIEPNLRMRYDYDNIQRLYQEYNHVKVDDKDALQSLKHILYCEDGKKARNIHLLMPGSSIATHKEEILKEIQEKNSIVIMTNFIDEDFLKNGALAFWGSSKRYEKYRELREKVQSVITSNVESDNENDLVVNYDSYTDRTEEYSDNTSLMLLRVLQRIGITSYSIAGFDGFSDQANYFKQNEFSEERFRPKYDEINKALSKLLKNFADSVGNTSGIKFITPSIYEHIFNHS